MPKVDEEAMLAVLELIPNGRVWIKALRSLNHLSVIYFNDYACGGAVRLKSEGGAAVPVPTEALDAYIVKLRSADAETFPTSADDVNRQKLMALIDLVRYKVDATRAQLLDGGALAEGGGADNEAADSKVPRISRLRAKPAPGPGASGAAEPPSRAGCSDRVVMLVLTWLYLAGSAAWLKLILANSLLLSLNYDILYEREVADPHFHVAKDLRIQSGALAALDSLSPGTCHTWQLLDPPTCVSVSTRPCCPPLCLLTRRSSGGDRAPQTLESACTSLQSPWAAAGAGSSTLAVVMPTPRATATAMGCLAAGALDLMVASSPWARRATKGPHGGTPPPARQTPPTPQTHPATRQHLQGPHLALRIRSSPRRSHSLTKFALVARSW